MSLKKTGLRLLVLSSLLALGACQNFSQPAGSYQRRSDDRVAGAMVSAARDAADEGMMGQSLAFHEKLYNRDPRNTEYIINYAAALRRVGRVDDATLVVRTPARDPKAGAPILTEAALVLIAGAKYEEAKTFAKRAVDTDKKSPDAWHALALAESGQQNFKSAQGHFEKALSLWPEHRDKTPVINNLAMCLTVQGRVDKAREVMALATGEALQSRTYQNNRALLDILQDVPRVEKLPPLEMASKDAAEDMADEKTPKPESKPEKEKIMMEKLPKTAAKAPPAPPVSALDQGRVVEQVMIIPNENAVLKPLKQKTDAAPRTGKMQPIVDK